MQFMLFFVFVGLLFPNISGFLTLSQTQTGSSSGSKTQTDISDVLYLVVEEKALGHQLEEFVLQMKNDIEQLKQNQTKSCVNRTALLEQEIHSLKLNNSHLDQNVKSFIQEVQTLQQKNSDLEQKVQVLQRNNSNFEQTVNSLQAKERNIEQAIHNLQQKDSDISHLAGALNTRAMTIAGLQTSIAKISEKVAFAAHLNRDRTVGRGFALVFERTISNFGGGYDNTTGKFTCTTPGIYLVHVTIVNGSSGGAYAYIVRSGRPKQEYIYTGSSRYGYSSGSVDVFYSLSTGDQVFIESGGHFSFYGHSYFSGVLITAA